MDTTKEDDVHDEPETEPGKITPREECRQLLETIRESEDFPGQIEVRRPSQDAFGEAPQTLEIVYRYRAEGDPASIACAGYAQARLVLIGIATAKGDL